MVLINNINNLGFIKLVILYFGYNALAENDPIFEVKFLRFKKSLRGFIVDKNYLEKRDYLDIAKPSYALTYS